MSVVVATQDLSKTYRAGFWKTKTISALDRLNLEVRENEILGYLGPNGAGKSTTLKLLMSLIYPSSGKAEILGQPASDVSMRRHIGYLPENPYFYEYLSAEEFLSYCASLFDFSVAEIRTKVEYFLKLTDIAYARKIQLRKFSKEASHIEIVVSNTNLETIRQAVGPDVKISQSGMTLRLELKANVPLTPLVTYIERASGKVLAINPIRQTMEDYFFKLINRDAILEG